MSIKSLISIHDLVQGETAPVADMESQTGPAFSIVGPGIGRGLDPFNIPAGSQLHGGPAENQPGRSLVGPAYQYAYGGASTSIDPSGPAFDMNGATPSTYLNNLPEGITMEHAHEWEH